MIKGSYTLFNDIIDSPLKITKGRSERLDDMRNQCLIDRYWYMMNLTGWRYDLLLKVISIDFFISQRTVYNILNDNHALLRSTRQEQPAKKDLEKKWPQLNWEMPDIKLYV